MKNGFAKANLVPSNLKAINFAFPIMLGFAMLRDEIVRIYVQNMSTLKKSFDRYRSYYDIESYMPEEFKKLFQYRLFKNVFVWYRDYFIGGGITEDIPSEFKYCQLEVSNSDDTTNWNYTRETISLDLRGLEEYTPSDSVFVLRAYYPNSTRLCKVCEKGFLAVVFLDGGYICVERYVFERLFGLNPGLSQLPSISDVYKVITLFNTGF